MAKLQAALVFEILGRPPKHITDSLNMLVSKLSEEKGITIIDKKIHEPIEVKDSKDLFTTFAEVTVDFDSFENYLGIIFAYMPSNVELISPEEFLIKNEDFTFLANKIVGRLHDYDSIAKRILSERDFFVQKLKEVSPETFKSLNQSVNLNNAEKSRTKKSVKKKRF